MNSQQIDEKAVFNAARQIAVTAARDEYLAKACGDDKAAIKRIQELLRIHEQERSFLESPAVDLTPTTDTSPIAERPGTVIGPYKLLQQIGEGGMGVVFMAEQTEPIQRTVALKIIKPGMDTRQVIARFEAERQALALMDHPNIAKVLDAGTTESGRPYFVMELVKGVPITQYCDEKKLSLRQRLELFKPVCEAVQHAHQKGIIHRDIKPSNVVVPEYDDRAVPKVIDFGVAKATAQKLTERTMFTEFGQVIGTVEYMSPEQAKFNQLDIDTRSDIYSLGVLLYELLAGSTPFERERLREAAFDEVLRIIREEEPPKPSTRLSTSETLPSIAANRHTEPARLSKDVSGELDWIVMKCLEKDRNRRYETASGLERDIERYLLDEPVQACPPSATYRFRKFARRNKAALIVASAATAMLLALVTGLAISNRLIAAQRAQAEDERNEKTVALAQKELALKQAEAERRRAQDNLTRVTTAVRDILFEAAVGRGEWAQLPDSLRTKFAERTGNFYQSLLQQGSSNPSLQYETAVGLRGLALLHGSRRDFQQEESFARQALVILDRLVADYPTSALFQQQQAWSNYILGLALRNAKRPQESEAAIQLATVQFETLISRNPNVASYYNELPHAYGQLSSLQKSRGATKEAEQTVERLLGLPNKVPAQLKENTDIYSNVATALKTANQTDKAISLYKELTLLKPNNAAYHSNLGTLLIGQGKLDEGFVACNKAIDLDPHNVDFMNYLAWLLATTPDARLRDAARAVDLASRAVKLAPKVGSIWNTLGVAQYRAGRWQNAIESLETSLKLRNGGDASDWIFLAMAHWQIGNRQEARTWYDKSIEWIDKKKPADDEICRFRTEAAELLGINIAESAVHAAAASGQASSAKDPQASIDANIPLSLTNPGHQVDSDAIHQADPIIGQITLADTFRSSGQFDKAIAAYRTAIELQPDRVRSYMRLGYVLTLMGKNSEAEATYREALDAHPQDPEFLKCLAAFLSTHRRHAEAEPLYREIVRLRPRDASAFALLARNLFMQRKHAVGKTTIRDMIQTNASSAEVQQQAGAILARYNELADAEKVYREAIRLRPDDAWCHQNLGWVLQATNKKDEAQTAFREAGRLDPQIIVHAASDADALARSGQLHDAADKLAAIFGAAPNNSGAAFRLAALLWTTGDQDGYEGVCQAMLKQFNKGKDPYDARRTAQVCLLSSPPIGNLSQLRDLTDFAVSQATNSTSSAATIAYREQGLAAYRGGDWTGAIKSARKSRELSIRQEYHAQNYAVEAMALYRLGESSKARSTFNESIKSFAAAFPTLPDSPSELWVDWLTYEPLRREASALILRLDP